MSADPSHAAPAGRLALLIDLERCIGCKSCEVACKQEHGLGPGEYRNRVVWLADPERPGLDFLPVACQHCARPACLRACPVNPKAITKDAETGVVRVDEDRCTGCGECVVACPYGAMGYDSRDHHAVKCDLCAERRAAGRDTACASVCPGHAIQLGRRDELLTTALAQGREVRDHDAFLLGPATLYLDRVHRPERRSWPLDRGTAPVLVDDPSRRGALGESPTAYPYRAPRAAREAERVEPGGCNICFNCCSTQFHFHGDRLVRITGNPDDPVLKGKVCPKSQLTVQLYASEHRLTRPLMRIGPRGEGRFEPVSWETALDAIAERLRAVRERHGPETLGIFSGTRTGLLTNRGYIRLFSQLWGTPNVQSTEPFCSSGKNLAYTLTQGTSVSGNSYTESDIGSAALYVYVGDNQAETRPVYFGMVNDWRIRNGARMVVVDPRHTVTASKADRWLPIRTGTDLALALAMIHHILTRGLEDRAFCARWVLGWEDWRDFVAARGYTPDWAAPITGLAAADIRWLAEQIATADGCVIFGSRGLNQHTNSLQTNRAFMFLAAITGNWGRPGGAYFNMSASVPIGADAPAERRVKPTRPMVRQSPTGWLRAMIDGRPYPMKALIACNNPLAQWPDQDAAREALSALDLLVHIDLFPNETSAYADFVLPAATGIEKGEIGRANDDRRIVWIDRMVEPPGEARPDGWIWIELGKRLGFDDVLEERFKDSALFWDERLIGDPQVRGITQRRLHSVPYRWVRFPVESEDAPERDTLYLEGTTAIGQPEGKRFPTASGKLEFFTEALEARFAKLGLSALPEFYGEREHLVDLPWLELLDADDTPGVPSPFYAGVASSRGRIVQPREEAPGARLRAQGYDTELVTGRAPAPQFHGWTHYAWQAQEMWPDLFVQIHPEKAAALGIEDGERVRIETAHGAIEARAWIYAGIRPTAVFVPIGWGERQPFHPWRSVNFLTDASQRDPTADQTNLKSLLCRVVRLER
ncbi:MAG: molybdopterin-dependent oxidoreductase [Ectothiorhodospiraceae bacterium]|nr:molybdopterin-dependent oxidoreductase [Ectothiorhodospiraceae bacterium]